MINLSAMITRLSKAATRKSHHDGYLHYKVEIIIILWINMRLSAHYFIENKTIEVKKTKVMYFGFSSDSL